MAVTMEGMQARGASLLRAGWVGWQADMEGACMHALQIGAVRAHAVRIELTTMAPDRSAGDRGEFAGAR